MSSSEMAPRTRPLRLWPGVTAAVLLLTLRALPIVAPNLEIFGLPSVLVAVLGAVLCGALILLWWLLLSRAPWLERLATVLFALAALSVTWFLVDESIRGGMMGRMLPVFSVPAIGLAIVAATLVTNRRTAATRRVALAIAILLACGLFTLIRTDGITGEGDSQLHWRWTPTAEERLLAQGPEQPTAAAPAASVAPPNVPAAAKPPDSAAPAAPNATTEDRPAMPENTVPRADPPASAASVPEVRPEWPGFRGPRRDSVVRGTQIETDWTTSPPVELWRRPIGPGWSSFAVNGDLIYTQEQRGEEELVSCYRLSTGAVVWRHADPVRFYESNGGPGPRGTPTLSNGRVFALGATGMLNALDAATGSVLWSRNAATDADVAIPEWGIASSPLVVDDTVIVALSGRLAAYDINNGTPRWRGPTGGAGYSSPHLATIDGVPQVLLLRGSRTISVSPKDGALLWEHSWQPGVSIVQPAVIAENDIVVTAADGMGGLGVRRLAVMRKDDGWSVEERWTSRGLKPYFNDFVVHKGHAYGFDGSILSSIDLGSGERNWKNGRYGHGQMILLADQDLLLVISEDGELVLVRATPDAFAEVARISALNAKTWNHPVLVRDTLLVRNGEEMVAFRLPAETTH